MRVDEDAEGIRYTSIRLMEPKSHKGFWPESAPYHIGDVWDLDLEDPVSLEPPHVEDKLVRGGRRVRRLDNRELEHRLLEIASDMTPQFYWEGDPQELFGGKLMSSGNGKGYVTRADIPNTSTGFWITDRELILNHDVRGKSEYHYDREWSNHPSIGYFRYVGESKPIALIPRETLIRVSLARWWTAGDYQEACWLMMSGWY